MELYERQQFDFLLQTSVERYVERIEQRNEGATNALERLLVDRKVRGSRCRNLSTQCLTTSSSTISRVRVSCCALWRSALRLHSSP